MNPSSIIGSRAHTVCLCRSISRELPSGLIHGGQPAVGREDGANALIPHQTKRRKRATVFEKYLKHSRKRISQLLNFHVASGALAIGFMRFLDFWKSHGTCEVCSFHNLNAGSGSMGLCIWRCWNYCRLWGIIGWIIRWVRDFGVK
jgi:hypothetical protein